VFRDEAPQRVVDIVHTAGLKAVQLHGHESPDTAKWIRVRVPFVIQAFSAGDRNLERADSYGTDAILIDSATPGSGEVFDWSLAEGAPAGRKVIIAGGLTPENVADAIERIGPWGVDVSSGVEAVTGDAGRKDARKVRQFIANAKAAAPPRYQSTASDAPYDWLEDD